MLYYFKNCQVFLANCVHTHINTYVHTYMPTYIHTYIYIYIYTHTRCITLSLPDFKSMFKGSSGTKNIINYISLWHLSGYIPHNLFNPTSDYSEILIVWHLRKVVSRLVIFVFTRKSFTSEAGRLMEHVYKGLQECASAVVVSADPLSPILSTLSALNNPYKSKDEPDDTEPIPEYRSKQACLWFYNEGSSNQKMIDEL